MYPLPATSQGVRTVTFPAADGRPLAGSLWESGETGAVAVLLVHDREGDRTIWEHAIPRFLARGWTVLTFDLRGHGDSLAHGERAALPGGLDAGLAADVRGALAFLATRPVADPARIAAVGLGRGADLVWAAAARDWGAASAVCVSPDEARARAFAGPGPVRPRGVYVLYGARDALGTEAALAFAAVAREPAESYAYDDDARRGASLWTEREPEIVARTVAWIERTLLAR